MRRLAARAHLWGGLLLGPVVLVLGLSGAALVFRAELDAPPAVTPGPPRALDAIAAAALVAEPGGEVHALRIPPRADQPYRVEIRHGARQVHVLVDPATLRVLDRRAPERSILAAVRSLHARFHAGRPGAVAVAFVGVALVLEILTGMWLYGPRRWRRIPGARERSRRAHRLVGAVALPITVIIGGTGVALAAAGFGTVAPVPASAGVAGLDALAVAAQSAVPGGTLMALTARSATLVQADLREATGRHVSLLVDRTPKATGSIRRESADAVWDAVVRLHYGDFGGTPTRVAWVLAGLAVPALTVTGYLAATRARHAPFTGSPGRRAPAAPVRSSSRAPSPS